MRKVVISQPMFFPWIGIFEQIRLADLYIHYDDVQFPLGRSFTSRVQIRTPNGIQWLTVPVERQKDQLIKDVLIDDAHDWRSRHLKTLRQSYGKAKFGPGMLELADEIYSLDTRYLGEFNRSAIERIARFFGLPAEFAVSSGYRTGSASSEKLLDLMLLVKGDVYITGHGARNYLDHELFEKRGVAVEYMDYKRTPYPQVHGDFDPHVSILDLIANTGKEGIRYIDSGTKNWREFTGE